VVEAAKSRDPDSMINHPLPQVVLTSDFRPKEKVGENPPDNDDAPIRKRDYTERREARQTAGNERGLSPLPLAITHLSNQTLVP